VGNILTRNCENPLPVKYEMMDGLFILNHYKSAADCSM